MNGSVVRAYSLAKDGELRPYLSNGKRCANFKVREFACHDGSDPIFISPAMVDIVQAVRTRYGKPVYISNHSAYRTPPHNKREGGSAYSYHLFGRAVDFHVEGVSVDEVAAYIETLMPYTGGLIIYRKQGFLHVDDRMVKYRAVM